MTKTREVDEFGNVSYALRNEDGSDAGRIHKTCSNYWLLVLPSGSEVRVSSVKAGMEWFDFHARLMARPPVTAL